MTKPPDRVWVVIDPQAGPQFAAAWDGAAHDHITDAIGRDILGAVQWFVHEYRPYRPINWRTGTPDAEMVARGRRGDGFAVRTEDGSLLRKAAVLGGRAAINDPAWQFIGWAWDGLPLDADVTHWCPEDEMPKGETA